MPKSKTKTFGILTSGGDCPGLNAAIRGVCKAATGEYDMRVVGIANGYRGLIEGNARVLRREDFSGILTQGGTILGASREKPFKTNENDSAAGGDKIKEIKTNYKKMNLDCLVVLGGNGTHKTAYRLQQEGLNVIGLPKTIDNDLAKTDVTFGFYSATDVATEAIDRLHSTAHAHNRVMVVETMGHKAGWLALTAGIAGGADTILIPEIPYSPEAIAAHIETRRKNGKPFSIVAVAEGAMSKAYAKDPKRYKASMGENVSTGYVVAREIEALADIETRVTVLGYLQRGGTPSPADRLLATRLGVRAAKALAEGDYGKMVALKDDKTTLVPLKDVQGKLKLVSHKHELIENARLLETCLGEP